MYTHGTRSAHRHGGFVLLFLLAACIPLAAQPAVGGAFTPTTTPAFQLDYATPTADKPQSKLWYTDGAWWALLPRSSGPSLWQRTESGWVEHQDVARSLGGVPGRADVWPEAGRITAAAVTDVKKTNSVIAVIRLDRRRHSGAAQWEPRVLARLLPPTPGDAIETVTIVCDSAGRWWVAAVAGIKVCVWTAPADAAVWSGPIVLAEGVDADDLCTVTPLPRNEVGIIWSDQVREAFLMRTHAAGADPNEWGEETAIQQGGKIGDDHLNTVLAPGGTLWLATKNSIDTVGRPQFTLFERTPQSTWQAWPYAVLGETTSPSRPIVVSSADGATVLTGYGDSDRALPAPHGSRIVFSRVNPANPTRIDATRTVIAPDPALNSTIQNVTGPRHPFPADAPWIVLASDKEGRVYEADLRAAFGE